MTFTDPSCTSIGNGCFLAESTCERATTTTTNPSLQETTRYNYLRESDVIWIVTLFGVFTMMCVCVSFCWILFTCKGKPPNRNTNYDEEGNVNTPLVENNQRDEMKDTHAESPLEKSLFAQWHEEDTCFITTEACKQVENKIKSHTIVVVTGHPGSGKSATVQHIALKYRNRGWIVKPVTEIKEIIEACSSRKYSNNKILFVINDSIGKIFFNDLSYHSWKGNKEALNSVLKTEKLLLACRKTDFVDNGTQNIFEKDVAIVDFESPQCKLTDEEKRHIWNIHTSNTMLSESDFAEIFKTGSHFPLLCKLFGKDNQQIDARKFFKEHIKVFEDEIRKFRLCDFEKYCALVLLVIFNNELRIDDLLENDNKFKLALKLCGLLDNNTPPHIVKDNLELLIGFLVKKNNDTYHFYHDFVMDVTSFVIGKDYPEYIINFADIGFLLRRVRLDDCSDKNDPYKIYINDSYLGNLVERLFVAIFEERFLEVVLNPCLKDKRVIGLLKEKIDQHPEKIQLLLKKKTPQVENLKINKTSDNLLERLTFIGFKKEISPLFVLILFCHTEISLYCLRSLPQAQANLKEHQLLIAVCCNGSTSLFKMFSIEYIKDSLTEMWGGCFPIHIVSLFHNFEIMSELIRVGADVNMLTENIKQWPPLICAVTTDINENSDKYDENHSSMSRRDHTVLLLLKKGAKTNACTEDGFNSIYIACQNGHERIVERLIENGANVNCYSIEGASPLFVACEYGRYSTVKLLLDNNADVRLCTKERESPLFIACENGHDIIVQHLLEKVANITSNERSRDSHVLLSGQKEYNCIAQPILSKCAFINLCKNNGASPLYIACKNNRESTVQLLLRNGADLNLCKKDGTSPLFIACKNEKESLVRVLLDNGADINLCTEDGTSPLYISCQNGNGSLVQLLLDNGADINRCTEDGTSPLYIASNAGNDNVRILINHKAEVNLCRKNGASPLYAACQNNHYSTVKFLLCNGANIDLCKKDGTSPFCIAHENKDILNALNENKARKDNTSPLFYSLFLRK